MTLWDQEPFATFRSRPVRFGVGLPAVFVGGAVAGALVVRASLSLALAVQLALQTAGFLWLYVPAFRARRREEESDRPPRPPRERR